MLSPSELARLTGVSTDTLRHYERKRVLSTPPRSQGGYLDRFLNEPFDYVITVCDRAAESCPVFPDDPERIHWSFEDPAAVEGTETERLDAFRRIRNQIHERVKDFCRKSLA